MIISHEHRFIFIKTGKTAGTSVEIALSQVCGARDVITPISAEDEAVRREVGGRGPQNWVLPVSAWTLADWGRVVRRPTRPGKARPRFYHHMPAAEIAARVGPGVWGSYYKFCFTRNPWDRAVSLYYWRHPTEPRPGIAEFLQSDEAARILRHGTRGRYTIDGKVAVDRVCRFESLEADLNEVLERVGVKGGVKLPRTKAGTRGDRRPYREVLDEACRRRVEEVCGEEIGGWGYGW